MVSILFQTFTLMGSEWVLWILMALSIVCVAMILERMRSLRSQEKLGSRLWKDKIDRLMQETERSEIQSKLNAVSKTYPCIEGQVVDLVQSNKSMTKDDLKLAVESYLGKEKLKLEKNLAFLGTIGANAPFIGLFGTVLGIIKAFHDLGGKVESGGAQSVSMGLSEALVATAVGLLVAIPAVMAFNYFQRKIKAIMNRSQSLADFLISIKS